MAATAALLMLTGCTDKFDGEWSLFNEDDDEIGTLEFNGESEVCYNGEFDGKYEILDDDVIKLEWENEILDDAIGGKYDYEILDKDNKEICLEDLEEDFEDAEMELSLVAKTMYNAGNIALVEMDYEDKYIQANDGVYSTKEKYSTLSDDPGIETFLNYSGKCFDEMDDYEYIMIIEYGVLKEVYVGIDRETPIIGSYPSETWSDGDTLNEIGEDIEDCPFREKIS